MTESALLALLGVACKAARPLGRGFGGGVTRQAWAGTPARWIFGCWFGPCRAHVGLLGASRGALGHVACVFERVWVSLTPFDRFGVGILVYFRSNFHFLCDFSFIRRYFFAFEAIANTL